MAEIVVPAGCLVVLIGVAGAGKSTFAARHFGPTQVLSSDTFRAIVADDPADQRASAAAFELLHLAARRRLERRRLTVIDATNVSRVARRTLVGIAQATRRPAVAIVLDLPLATTLAQNAHRSGRTVADAVVVRQASDLRRTAATDAALLEEGFVGVHRFVDHVALGDVSAVRVIRRDRGAARLAEPGTIPQGPVDPPRDRRRPR